MAAAEAVVSIYLRPGELCVQSRPSIVTTVLGSCISVTLFNKRLAVGALCHALMPLSHGCPEIKYVDYAIEVMVRHLRHKGVGRGEIQAKLFGGSDMFTGAVAGARQGSVGQQNVTAALAALDRAGIPIAAWDVRGTNGRKILFHTHTGEIYLKRLGQREQPALNRTGGATW
jgi:chemotaxis protein CheD